MGNCQAAEAATVVVQHPGGRVERLYWATSAAEVMRANPGHYVALVTRRPGDEEAEGERRGAARVTRVKLLKPRDTLALGQAYRLITVAEVARALQAKKEDKTRRAQQQLVPLQPKRAGGRASAGEDSQPPPPPQLVDDGLDLVLPLPCYHHPALLCSVSPLFPSSSSSVFCHNQISSALTHSWIDLDTILYAPRHVLFRVQPDNSCIPKTFSNRIVCNSSNCVTRALESFFLSDTKLCFL